MRCIRRPMTQGQQLQVAEWARDHFGPYAGYANQYLFHWAEPHKTGHHEDSLYKYPATEPSHLNHVILEPRAYGTSAMEWVLPTMGQVDAERHLRGRMPQPVRDHVQRDPRGGQPVTGGTVAEAMGPGPLTSGTGRLLVQGPACSMPARRCRKSRLPGQPNNRGSRGP